VTCIDARLDPLEMLDLDVGDAHVMRNAGGIVTEDVLRSLAISHHLLGTVEAHVIGHTECGLTAITNEELRALIGPFAAGVDFLPFIDVDSRVRESVRAIFGSPLLPSSFRARGSVYDVATGELRLITP
jgi:carbonic anhydrase